MAAAASDSLPPPSSAVDSCLIREGVRGADVPAHEAQPRLLDRVRAAVRLRHYSRRTEKAYVGWVRRFVLFHGKRHPVEMGKAEVSRFLSHLAVEGKASASTQNQALSALLFLYAEVLGQDIGWLDEIVRAKRPARLPVVLTHEEVRAVLSQLDGKRCTGGSCYEGASTPHSRLSGTVYFSLGFQCLTHHTRRHRSAIRRG